MIEAFGLCLQGVEPRGQGGNDCALTIRRGAGPFGDFIACATTADTPAGRTIKAADGDTRTCYRRWRDVLDQIVAIHAKQ